MSMLTSIGDIVWEAEYSGPPTSSFNRAIGKAAKKMTAKKKAQAVKRKRKVVTTRRPKPGIKPRRSASVRPSGKPGGIAPRKQSKPTAAPGAGSLPPKKALPKDPGRKGSKQWLDVSGWPSNWDTSAPGPKVDPPSEVKKRRRKGAGVSQSDMYKHVVRAIYVTGKQNGYPFSGTAAKSSQAIARAKMIKWGYARRTKKKGGVPDRFVITLTPKGQQRNKKKHVREPRAVRAAKGRDYRAIVATDPL